MSQNDVLTEGKKSRTRKGLTSEEDSHHNIIIITPVTQEEDSTAKTLPNHALGMNEPSPHEYNPFRHNMPTISMRGILSSLPHFSQESRPTNFMFHNDGHARPLQPPQAYNLLDALTSLNSNSPMLLNSLLNNVKVEFDSPRPDSVALSSSSKSSSEKTSKEGPRDLTDAASNTVMDSSHPRNLIEDTWGINILSGHNNHRNNANNHARDHRNNDMSFQGLYSPPGLRHPPPFMPLPPPLPTNIPMIPPLLLSSPPGIPGVRPNFLLMS
jgi:hypothetical protein